MDKNKTDHVFRENELVYIENVNKLNRNKLDEIRSGPFRIIKKVSNSIYEIEGDKKCKKSNFYHSSKLIAVHRQAPNSDGELKFWLGGGEV